MPCGAFSFLVYVNICGDTFGGSKAIFGGSPLVFLVWALQFLLPGIPSIYYGSEFGIKGARNSQGDFQLRPSFEPFSQLPDFAKPNINSEDLWKVIQLFAKLRQNQVALQKGDYKGLSVTNETVAFQRTFNQETIIVAVNASNEGKNVSIGDFNQGDFENLLTGEKISGNVKEVLVPENWVTILKKR